MLNFANTGRSTETRRILLALALSLLLHIALVLRFGLLSSDGLVTTGTTLQVHLLAPVATKIVVSEVHEAIVPDISSPLPEQKTPRKLQKSPRVPAFQPKSVEQVPGNLASVEPTPSSPKAPVQLSQPTGVPRPGLAGPVRRADIEFEIFSGADRQMVGRGRHLYASENGENFGVSIKQSAKEPGATWQLDISGEITKQGLSPLVFEMRGGVPERLLALKEVPVLESVLPEKIRKGRMPDGILDRQSLLYQFMLKPPTLSGGDLWLTDGVRHALYSYRIAGLESLIIPSIGNVATVKLVLSTSDSSETIELWLVADLHYLPAKVRHTDKQGEVTEQVVISLDYQ